MSNYYLILSETREPRLSEKCVREGEIQLTGPEALDYTVQKVVAGATKAEAQAALAAAKGAYNRMRTLKADAFADVEAELREELTRIIAQAQKSWASRVAQNTADNGAVDILSLIGYADNAVNAAAEAALATKVLHRAENHEPFGGSVLTAGASVLKDCMDSVLHPSAGGRSTCPYHNAIAAAKLEAAARWARGDGIVSWAQHAAEKRAEARKALGLSVNF
jgi:hypothetical protein